MLKYVYIIILALFIVAFIGFGIYAFCPRPVYPEYPVGVGDMEAKIRVYSDQYKIPLNIYPYELKNEAGEKISKKEFDTVRLKIRKIHLEYDRKLDDYHKREIRFQENVSVFSLVIALIILALSMTVLTRIPQISEGAFLGGLFTLIYSDGRAIDSGIPKFEFIITTICLAMVIVVGFIRRDKIDKSTV